MTPQLPADERAVRRLLADARHDEPTPHEVVARLDEVLAGLVAERSPGPVSPPVVDLAARRRRRRASQVLAAAAVVVAGVGIGQVLQDTSGSDVMSTAGDAPAATQDQALPGQESLAPQDSGGAERYSAEERDERVLGDALNQSGAVPRPLPSLTNETLKADLALLRDGTQPLSAWRVTAKRDAVELTCTSADVRGRGRILEATYDGQPVTVVFRPARGERQRVDLYACDSTTPLRSVWLRVGG